MKGWDKQLNRKQNKKGTKNEKRETEKLKKSSRMILKALLSF